MRFSFLLRLPVLLFIAHCYVAWRLAAGMDGRAAQFGTILVVGLSYLILMAGFMARDQVGKRWADAVSWAGFLMLGFFSWLFVLTALRDVVLGLIFVLKRSAVLGSGPW